MLNIISKVIELKWPNFSQWAVQYLKFRVHGLLKTFSLLKSSSYLPYTVCITVPYLALAMAIDLSPVGSLNPFKWPEWDRMYVGTVLAQIHWYTYIIYIKYLTCVCEQITLLTSYCFYFYNTQKPKGHHNITSSDIIYNIPFRMSPASTKIH